MCVCVQIFQGDVVDTKEKFDGKRRIWFRLKIKIEFETRQ